MHLTNTGKLAPDAVRHRDDKVLLPSPEGPGPLSNVIYNLEINFFKLNRKIIGKFNKNFKILVFAKF